MLFQFSGRFLLLVTRLADALAILVSLKAKNFPDAIAMYGEAIALDPSNHIFFSNRSAAHLSDDNAVAALADGAESVRLKPDWPKGYGRKGAALRALKRYNDAEATYREGVRTS